ncbi:nucleoporin p58/p45-like [Cimex lectularius]|uniref:Nucleoporin Nup58 n=1 Tax=Cimex lectularius TaxID=79782 RepID=A0A8I6RMD6_CIMLE|nr:nucleoporin p58/p45-like [Cimex lectularius]
MLGSGSSIFGKPAGTSTTQPPAFGATTGTVFGSQPQAQQPSLFGSTTPSFGFPAAATTASSTPGLGLGFGAQTGFKPAATTAQTTQPSIFGTGLTTNKGTGFSTPAAQPTLNFGLGSNANKPTGFTLGTPSTATASTTAGGLTFGLPSATTTTVASSAPSLSIGFGSTATAPTTTTSTLNFGLGSTLTTTTTQSGLNFSLGPSFTTSSIGLQTTTQGFSLGTTTATTTPSLGLGALPQPTTTNLGLNPLSAASHAKSQKQESSKDRPLPPELVTQVEALREFVKQQKSYSSEVSQASLKPILKVGEDADVLKRITVQLERELAKNRVLNKKLKTDLTRSIQDCEIVQRLAANQRGFPCDNTIAFDYFQNIISRFQSQVEMLSSELKDMEKHVSCRLNPVPFTPEELAISMKRLYECFVALAGRYQAIHSSITALKLEVGRRKDMG